MLIAHPAHQGHTICVQTQQACCLLPGNACRCGVFNTVMAYQCSGSTRIAYLSNPNLRWNGRTIGDASTGWCAKRVTETAGFTGAVTAEKNPTWAGSIRSGLSASKCVDAASFAQGTQASAVPTAGTGWAWGRVGKGCAAGAAVNPAGARQTARVGGRRRPLHARAAVEQLRARQQCKQSVEQARSTAWVSVADAAVL